MYILKVFLIIHAYFSIAYALEAYKIIVKRVEFTQQRKENIHVKTNMTRINRYTLAFNTYFEVKHDVPLHYKASIRVYEFLNNEYRPFAIKVDKSFCSFLETGYKTFIYPDMIRIGAHMPKPKCPILKGNYFFENFTLSTEHYPATLPFHNGLLKISILNGTAVDLVINAYFIVDRDVVIRERYS